ncbi:MAG: DUF599 family protein [Candidatus Hodarchaeales archaeon]|jgi:uncharacterized membrane protein
MDIYLEMFALVVFGISIIVYTIMLIYGLRNPDTSRKGSLIQIYKRFVDVRIQQSPLIAIQAMRNLIMANSAFISALLVLLGILLAFYEQVFSPEVFPNTEISLGFIQMVLMVLIIVFCLFNFVLAIRMSIRFTLLISSEPSQIDFCSMDGITFTKNTMISAQNHWSFGLRGLFYLITVIGWIVHPILFIIGTLGVTGYLIFFEDIFERSKVEEKYEDK